MKKLIIAEKPSVASDIARVLGKARKIDDYFENDEYVISSALGHLVELFMPDDIDKKLARWSMSTLPIIPQKFELKPIEKSKSKLSTLKKLLARADIDGVINACDAGREGELIFTYIYEITKCKKPRQRLWFSSMTPSAIKDAFSRLKTQDAMLPLQDAARCRSESDWLVGINGTRAITTRMFGNRGKSLVSVGRVQTPTLALIVDREREIQNFNPTPFWKLNATFEIENGTYEGVYQRADFKDKKDPLDKPDRIWSKEDADKVLAAVKDAGKASASDKKTLSKQIAPRLYDLTTLQREANNRFSFPAAKTLSVAQSLYEKHKLITYPRTDSRALPNDYRSVCKGVLRSMDGDYARHATKALNENYVDTIGKRVFDDAQVSDHFAIIPTEISEQKLSFDEQKIYDMIARRFIAAFYPEALFDVTVRTSLVGEYSFKTEGKVLKFGGWRDVYGKDADEDSEEKPDSKSVNLPALVGESESAKVAEAALKEDATKPPARYTEATLLSAMEGAGKFVEDEDLALAMKDKGLGTPATRAQIIDTLIKHKFIERDRRDLLPTTVADSLITFLRVLGVEDLTSPAMTGEWEHKLKLIEKGELSREIFMSGISKITTDLVDKARNFNEGEVDTKPTNIISPSDGKPLLESFRAFRSQDGAIVIYKTMGNRKLSSIEVAELVKNGQVGPLEGFKSKLGKPYTATLKFDEAFKVKFQFENNRPAQNGDGTEADAKPENLEDAPKVCKCPKCKKAHIVETSRTFQCFDPENKESKCNFKIYKTMLSHKVTAEEVEALCYTGKSPLIEDFVSNRTKKKFSAHLILKPNGDVGFEFQKKAFPKKKAKTSKTKEPAEDSN